MIANETNIQMSATDLVERDIVDQPDFKLRPITVCNYNFDCY